GVLYDKTKNTILCCPQGRQGEFSVPETVTTIGNEAFCGCSDLKSITIPDTVTTIGSEAFLGCDGLEQITCYATTPPRISSFHSYLTFENSYYENATLYVPEDVVEDYRRHEWGKFRNIVGIVPANNME
ncbi:MAG: leucine-rich repeat protein, partial [Prevotellaceae bacterium]|nr:leucine-rich repeat protein [Prevotellaceae bacterium]